MPHNLDNRLFGVVIKLQDIRLNSLTSLTPLTSWYAKVQLRNLKFVGNEVKEEEQLLKDSLLRIMMSAATVPQTLRAYVVDELENQL